MVTGAHIDGGPQLRATIRRAEGDLQNLKATHKDVADYVVDHAEPPEGETGALAGSGRGAGTATAAIMRWGGARVRYAGPIHFGWAARNIAPQPFGTEAAQDTEPTWMDMYADGVQTILNRIKGIDT